MQWTGEGLLIGVRRHGETSVVAEAMVAGRGRHLGLVRGGRSARLAPTLQPGNSVQLTWRARLDEHLGTYSVELLQARAADLIADRQRLYLGQVVCEHLHLLPERDPHDRILAMALGLLDSAPDGSMLARFELALLEELGFGLDLSTCAVTGTRGELTHVSPRTGRAVSRLAAEPFLTKLLRLPGFLLDRSNADATADEIAAALKLTGHFLEMHVWGPRQIAPPATREALVPMLAQGAIVAADSSARKQD